MAEEEKFDDLWDQESTGGELFKFEEKGTKLSGLVTARKDGKTKTGPATFYSVLTAKGEETFIPTKALGEDLAKFVRQYGLGKFIVEIELTDLKPGNFASPFKVFRVRAGSATESRLSALGIATFDQDTTTADEEAPM